MCFAFKRCLRFSFWHFYLVKCFSLLYSPYLCSGTQHSYAQAALNTYMEPQHVITFNELLISFKPSQRPSIVKKNYITKEQAEFQITLALLLLFPSFSSSFSSLLLFLSEGKIHKELYISNDFKTDNEKIGLAVFGMLVDVVMLFVCLRCGSV